MKTHSAPGPVLGGGKVIAGAWSSAQAAWPAGAGLHKRSTPAKIQAHAPAQPPAYQRSSYPPRLAVALALAGNSPTTTGRSRARPAQPSR